MTVDGSPEQPDVAAVRREVRDWLATNWQPGSDPVAFLAAVVDAGWAHPEWPADFHGRGASGEAAAAVIEEFRLAGAPRGGIGAAGIAASVIREFADSEQLRGPILRDLLIGVSRTCLLYSEPGAGSDLAGLQTRAERDGSDWVVNGQKVWTSGARTATHGLLAARTDWDVPKHKGITYFLLPMDQPGVEVRPIKQMTGHQTFNEVFLTDARLPDALRISAVNDGWRVLNAALAVERMIMGGGMERPSTRRGEDGAATSVRHTVVDLVAVAKEAGRADDAVMRQEIARIHALRRISGWNAERAKSEADMGVAAVLKLSMSTVLHGSARVHAQLIGTESMLAGAVSAQGEAANQHAMSAFINSIGGGSDQIQRNLIAERVLGLPRDPSVDRDIPFRDVRKASAQRSLGGNRN